MGYIEQSPGANEVVHYRARKPFIVRAFGWLVLLLTTVAAAILYTEEFHFLAAAAEIVGGILDKAVRTKCESPNECCSMIRAQSPTQ
jgi:hypothetical protein